MATVEFTPNLAKHIAVNTLEVEGKCLREIIDKICSDNRQLKSYLLDDQQSLRKHVTVFVNNEQLRDRQYLSDPITPNSSIYIAQALSGG